ncbi:hypothetical protein Aph01nite_78360 [Acrocarpospora phusangensis]|uniref:Uncharacterized protein n=1 Tax=Acrocarpospora phusangensis TaxID=1070424 RepID=A0A919QKN5_9ACTN|nr:hypothetical protein [Acrocarpospora phusangensis]GIH29526.1 hypothetical protein Aph01nite_78360 [Acrocarpospora phusangensis]
MSSVLLYLAIVAMWLGVLVPMWLRRDRYVYVDDEKFTVEGDTLTEPLPTPHESQNSDSSDVPAVPEPAGDSESLPRSEGRTGDGNAPVPAEAASGPVDPRRAEWRRRARITARRRRRLLWSILLFLASVVTAAVQIVPWWGITPSALVLVGYLAVLRVAVRIDGEQRVLAARAQAARARHARELRRRLEEAAREAEIIEIEARRRVQVFDQYADHRRAVGD